MRSVFRLITPLLWLPVAGLLYMHLNIGRRLFVERLGCGCEEGFNTNWLSLIVCLALLLSSGTGCWFGSRGLSRRWRVAYLNCCGIAFLVFFRQFMYYNLWA